MKLKLLLLLVLLGYTMLKADPYTDYILKAGAGLNGNIYSSDFDRIGIYKNCCPKYESAFGIAPNIFIGGEVKNFFKVFGYDISYAMTFAYNDLSATYTVNQHIGNYLGSDSYEKIIVDHKLDATIALLNNEHSLWFNPSKKLPLGIKLGLNFGIPITKTFNQREELVQPSDAYFPDGTKVFNPASGELPNASSVLLALSIGARYHIANFKEYDLFAHTGFNYGLNKVTSDLDWSINQINLGITLHYNIPKAEPPRPATPPIPPAPEPEAPKIAAKPEIILETEFDYKKVNSGDTLKITINKYEYNTYLSLIPIILFEKNSTNVIKTNFMPNDAGSLYEKNLTDYQSVNFAENYPDIVAEYLRNFTGNRINIVSESSDEDKSIVNERLEMVTQKLVKAGVDKSLITAEIIINDSKKVKNPALIDESRKIYFEFSKGGGLLETKGKTDYFIDNFNKVMNVRPVLKSELPAKFSGKTIFNNSNEVELKEGINQVVLASNMFINTEGKTNKFEIKANITDSDNNKAEAESHFYLISNEKLIKSYYNLNRNNKDAEIEEFILGFMYFDKPEFYLINTFALDYIRAKAAEGRFIEVIPLTDNLGTPEYNEILAMKRAANAQSLIGTTYNRYEVILPEHPVFNNDSPYGRMMNRSVIIRIK